MGSASPRVTGGIAGQALLLAVLCVTLAYLCKNVFNYYGGGAIIWFADAVAIAFLYRHPVRHWPLLLTALFVANVGAALAVGFGAGLAVMYALPSLAAVLCGALLLRYRCARGEFFSSLRAWLRFAVYAALVPALVGAGLGAAITAAFGRGEFSAVFVGWYVADAAGILVLLPLALMCRGRTLRALFFGPAPVELLRVTLVALGAVVLVLALVPYPFIFASLPLIWAAGRLELPQTLALIFASMLLLLVQVVSQGAPLVVNDSQYIGPALLLHALAAVIPAYAMAVATNIERQRNRSLVEMESASRLLAKSLAEEKQQLHVTLNAIAEAVVATDAEQRIQFLNPVAEQMSGWSLAQARGRKLNQVFYITRGEDGEPLQNPVEECLARREPAFTAEGAVLISRSGRAFDIKNSAAPLIDGDGSLLGAVMVLQDVSETRQLIRQLSYKAAHDDLTGLPNRDSFKRELLQASESVRDKDTRHVLAYIDLDRFKIINDSAGHLAGDALLEKIGQCLRGHLRSSDSVARLGGDEFGLLMCNCSKEQALARCEQLVRQIEALRFPWQQHVYDVGASIGITEIHRDNFHPGDLLSQADVACYSAKRASRGTVMLYEPEQSAAADQHREIFMASAIREALDARRLALCVQPVVLSSDNTSVYHHEVLVRMRDGSGKLLMPGAFIPAAECYGLMVEIDRWVVEEVLQRRAVEIARAGLKLALNISAEALGDAGFQAYLLRMLDNTRIPFGHLGFEITETAMVNQMASASSFVEALRARGCKVALDDFGNGFSSFNYLKSFAIDFIKIDGSFVRQVDSNFVDQIIVETINQVAHRLGARTIAEYVEDASTAERLHGIGVDLLQGYHVGRPVPLEKLLESLEKPVGAL